MYKAVIIGSGPAGYSCAKRLGQLIKEPGKVAIVEKDDIGGICINWGCTPSKSMITSAKYARYARNASYYGVNTGDINIDFSKVLARRKTVIDTARQGVVDLLEHWGVEIIKGEAEIVNDNTVKVGEKLLETENIVIATGSHAFMPDFVNPSDPTVKDSSQLFEINELPEEITIIGGGIIGMEFATIFSHMGVKVRIIEFLDRCLALFDEEIANVLVKELEGSGVEILTSHKVLSINNGEIKVENIKSNEQLSIQSPLNLIAIGRRAFINNSKLDSLQVSYDKKGIIINSYMQTNKPNIYAIGDSTGRSILAHVAINQGITAAENIMGMGKQMKYDVIPAVLYSLPEVASVGSVEYISQKDNDGNIVDPNRIKVYKYPFSANLRAHIEDHTKGMVKIWFDSVERKIKAVQIVGEYAGEIIQGYANIMELNIPIEKIPTVINAHPTYFEIIKDSIEFILGKALDYYEK